MKMPPICEGILLKGESRVVFFQREFAAFFPAGDKYKYMQPYREYPCPTLKGIILQWKQRKG